MRASICLHIFSPLLFYLHEITWPDLYNRDVIFNCATGRAARAILRFIRRDLSARLARWNKLRLENKKIVRSRAHAIECVMRGVDKRAAADGRAGPNFRIRVTEIAADYHEVE